VSLSEAKPGYLEVTLDLRDVPRDALALRAFGAKEAVRLSGLEATGSDGVPLRVEAGFEAATVGSRTVDVPRYVLPGPLPASIRVHYLVQPGTREGDSHVGYTGRCYGYVDDRLGFVTGRNLFLLPEPAESLRDIEVEFDLPDGWTAVTPWRKDGERWRPGLEGKLAAEHLITAAIGLGRFRERTVELGNTRLRMAFEAGIPAEQEEHTFTRLTQAARYIHDLFDRDLGPDYVTVIVPRAPTGDEIAGEGWATGQGGSLAPITANRLHDFAERLIDAYLRHAPYRVEVRRPEEFWLVDGIRSWYSWRAVASADLLSNDELKRELASGYMTTLNVEGVERDLEKLYSAPGSQTIAREVLAPFVLLHLDDELRSASKGNADLDDLLGRMFSGRKAESLWSLLPAVKPGFWEGFRDRYVKGTALAPVERFYTLTPTRSTPDPPGGPAVRHLTLAYTGDTTAYLENCGCKVNQSGGVARRATALERIRDRAPDALVLDAGDTFLRPKHQGEIDFLSRQEQSLYLRTQDLMGYQAAAISTTELIFGVDYFRAQTRGLSTPYLAANIRVDGKTIAPASVRLRSGGLRTAVIGIFEPPRGRDAPALFEENTVSLEVEDPVETLRREVPALSQQADLVVAMGRLSPFTIRRIAEACPDVDVILSTEFRAPMRSDGKPDSDLHSEDHEGFLGRTLVLYTHLTNYGLSTVRLGVDAEGRIASATLDDVWLNDKVPDQPQVRSMLNQFYDRVGKTAAAQESVPPLFSDDPARMKGNYAGATACAKCHEAEYAQWMTTGHAGAFKTLLDRHRHFQPKCVSCHVVGYGTSHGYKLGAPEQTLANVQCEVCHGPGADHVQAPTTANIRLQVPEKVCLECHTPDHSDHFVYSERLPRVRHDSFQAGGASAAKQQTPAGAPAGGGH
jgi:hypothetical protein